MQLWLLSHLRDSPGNHLALVAAQRRGHEVTLVDPGALHLVAAGGGVPGAVGAALCGPRGPEALPERVLTRLGSSAPPEALHVLEWLEAQGVPCTNRSEALRRARDKTRTLLALVGAGVPTPATVLLGPDAPLEAALEALPNPPWILKLPVSTQGNGVVLVESHRSLRSALDTLHGTGQRLLLQAFVVEAAGADLRVLVVGGTARASMRRQGQSGEFRSNLHRGGRAAATELTPELAALAERSAAALGLEVAGVDVLEARQGPLVIEVNGAPGLEGISAACGRDLAAEVVAYLEATTGEA